MLLYLNLILSLFLSLTHSLPFDCPTGTWGARCDRTCGQCDGGPEFCERQYGRCFNGCAAGYHGTTCTETCPIYKHGLNCRYSCGSCSYIAPICDPVTGNCMGGCLPGFQAPLCKLPCPYQTWGEDCIEACNCPVTPKCGCDSISGACKKCDRFGNVSSMVRKDVGPLCLNFESLLPDLSDNVDKKAFDIPWAPVASFFGLICVFVSMNFVYWLIFVRGTSKGLKDVKVYRDKKPKQLKIQDWKRLFNSLHFADRKLRIRVLVESNARMKKAKELQNEAKSENSWIDDAKEFIVNTLRTSLAPTREEHSDSE